MAHQKGQRLIWRDRVVGSGRWPATAATAYGSQAQMHQDLHRRSCCFWARVGCARQRCARLDAAAGRSRRAAGAPRHRSSRWLRKVRACITPPSMVVSTKAASSRRSHGCGRRAPGVLQALLDGIDPRGEVRGQPLSHRQVRLMQFEGEAADRAAVGALGVGERLAVAGEEGEHALDRVVARRARPAPAASCGCRRGTGRAPPAAGPACRGRSDRGCRC